jgi:hypothetical protein
MTEWAFYIGILCVIFYAGKQVYDSWRNGELDDH